MNALAEAFDLEEKEEIDNKGCMPVTTFLSAIIKVEKIKPVNEGEGATWRIHMSVDGSDDMITISNKDLMAGKAKFEDLFKSRFKCFLPYEITKKASKGKPSGWKVFQLELEQDCIEIEPIESIDWMESDILISAITELTCVGEGKKEDWAGKERGKKTLLRKEHEGIVYYLIKSADISAVIKELKLVTTIEKLGRTMDRREYKRKKNPDCRINSSKKVSCVWWFTETCMVEHGLNLDEIKTIGPYYGDY